MPTKTLLQTILPGLVFGLFFWFFASGISIAWHKAPQHDDAMFATIPKNFLNGYGWATSYGEKIPFNPDISTGPSLLLPAAAMIALFGNQTWVPAMTGTITNIFLTCLVLWQLWQLSRNRAASFLALLLTISLFMVNDFKTFTAYYTGCLLFLFSLLLAVNPHYSFARRCMVFGALAAVGLYAKPLILFSFLAALPCILLFECGINLKKHGKYLSIVIVGFLFIFSPWQIYKSAVLSGYSVDFQSAYSAYDKKFFEYHGTGIGQLKDADDKLRYLQNNTIKNFRILRKFLKNENSLPVYLFPILIGIAVLIFIRCVIRKTRAPFDIFFPFILALVILGNLLWYVIFSFAMTPGHAFFLTFFGFFLLFFLVAVHSRSNFTGVLLCAIMTAFFQVRIPPLIEAYQFKVPDLINNEQINKTLVYLETQEHRYPLASCGYIAAPYRMEYLLPGSQNFVDCYNVLEDSLAQDNNGNYFWHNGPNFTFVFEGLSFLAAAQSQSYILTPISDACQKHILFHEGNFIVCDVRFDEIKDRLDPAETARQLGIYQQWYRTRIKT